MKSTEKKVYGPGKRALISNSKVKSLYNYYELYQKSIQNPDNFWSEMSKKHISWFKEWDKTSSWSFDTASIQWFLGGKLNVCFNCIDRHLKDYADKVALIYEGNEVNLESSQLTFKELHEKVCRFANGLKKLGVQKSDRVAIYMPMVPEAVISMLACARIGAVHTVIFAGFSAESIKGRVLDAQCKVVITANEGIRGKKKFALKRTVDEALIDVSCVEHVVVFNRTDIESTIVEGRDISWNELIQDCSEECPCEQMDSEDPLFILYTSGSTGKPKGVVHTQGGYITYASVTHSYVFDIQPNDIFFCAADIGWITGHSYVVYGPLSNGVTTVIFEPLPNYPDAGRYWQTCEKLGVNIFYTAPTAIRSVAKEGADLPEKYDLTKLRTLGSVGEPINEDAWLWYYNEVGGKECSIVDTWWQTETGGILLTPLASATPTKPGSATFPFFGIQPVLVDEEGKLIEGNDVRGRLCIKESWPGQMRTVYGDNSRFYQTYFSQYPGLYFTGDAAIRDEDGYYWITGRVDDVINVSGHRVGTAEVESALVHSGIIAEAAVIGIPHEIKGTGVYAFCILKEGINEDSSNIQIAKDSVRKGIGGFAVPDYVQFVPGLPRTRSGKIMRRILRKIVSNELDSIGDISTLSDPTIVEIIAEGFKKYGPTGT